MAPKPSSERFKLKLASSRTFKTGIVSLEYAVEYEQALPIHRVADRDCLKTTGHGLTALPSNASSPRRRTPRRSYTTSRSPCSSCGCGIARQKSVLLPNGGVRPEILAEEAVSANRL